MLSLTDENQRKFNEIKNIKHQSKLCAKTAKFLKIFGIKWYTKIEKQQ